MDVRGVGLGASVEGAVVRLQRTVTLAPLHDLDAEGPVGWEDRRRIERGRYQLAPIRSILPARVDTTRDLGILHGELQSDARVLPNRYLSSKRYPQHHGSPPYAAAAPRQPARFRL